MKDSLQEYLLMLGDNSMVLGHRLSELCGHGPSLETDIALTNISLDLFGQVRSYFQYAAELQGNETSEDSIAFLRKERNYLNVVLLEQPNDNFAHVIVTAKSIKESKYHKRFSSEWVKRLGAGTDESHNKMQSAVNHLFPFAEEFFKVSDVEKEMHEKGIGADLEKIKVAFYKEVQNILNQATLTSENLKPRVVQGKSGIHSIHAKSLS